MDIGIVGSGFASYAAALALKPFKSNINSITIFTDGARNELLRFEGSKQINRVFGFAGTSRHWHGVSVLNGGEDYLRYLEDFYDIDSQVFLHSDYLYVPKNLPDLSSKWRDLDLFFGEKLKLLSHHVQRIVKTDTDYIVYFDNEFFYFTNLFVGVNVQDISSIKLENFSKLNYEIYDHIQVRLGLWHQRDMPSELGQINRFANGYVSSFLRRSDSIIMWRPYHGSIKNYRENQINFGLSKWRIILHVLLSLKISKLMEAFFTKYGLFAKSKYYVLYLQKRVKYSDINKSSYYDKASLDVVISEYNLKEPIIRDGKIILGNHQVGESDGECFNSSVLFGSVNNVGWLGGEHHTVKNMYRIHCYVRDSWFNK